MLFVSLILGCNSPRSESSTGGSLCSEETQQNYVEFQNAKQTQDPVLISNACARVVSTAGTKVCQLKKAEGELVSFSYLQIENECQAAANAAEKLKVKVRQPSLKDPKYFCPGELIQSYSRVVSSMIRLENSSSVTRDEDQFSLALMACQNTKRSFQSLQKCSADISNRRRWISWSDLEPVCQRADISYKTYGEAQAKFPKQTSESNVSDPGFSDGGLVLQMPLSVLPQQLQLKVFSGRDMTSIFALSSDQMEIFYSQGIISGKKAATDAASSGQVVCGLTREDIELKLETGDVFLSQKLTVKSSEEDSNLKRSILRFESSGKSAFWVSCLTKDEHDLSGQDIQSAFGSLIGIKSQLKTAKPSDSHSAEVQ